MSDDFRMTWQAAWEALQRLGFSPGESNEMLSLARRQGSFSSPLVDVQYFADDDTFGLYTEELDE
jgi:hypothetical protein